MPAATDGPGPPISVFKHHADSVVPILNGKDSNYESRLQSMKSAMPFLLTSTSIVQDFLSSS